MARDDVHDNGLGVGCLLEQILGICCEIIIIIIIYFSLKYRKNFYEWEKMGEIGVSDFMSQIVL